MTRDWYGVNCVGHIGRVHVASRPSPEFRSKWRSVLLVAAFGRREGTSVVASERNELQLQVTEVGQTEVLYENCELRTANCVW